MNTFEEDHEESMKDPEYAAEFNFWMEILTPIFHQTIRFPPQRDNDA